MTRFATGIQNTALMPYHGLRVRWLDRRVHTANTVVGEVVYQPRGSCGPRVQRDYGLMVLHSGECQWRLNGTVHPLKADRVYLMLPGRREHWQFSADKETHHSWCTVRPSFMPKRLAAALRRAPFSVPCTALFHSLLQNAINLRFSQQPVVGVLAEHLVLCLFAEFLHSAHKNDSSTGDDLTVRNFLLCVENHFGDENCLQLARQASGASRNSLLRNFHTAMQTTPAKYLWKFRVERGAAMLAETGQTAAEIAYRCGFKSPFHFSRLFKKHLGQSPKEFRRDGQRAGRH